MPITRKFRFEDLEIWKLSVEIGDALFDVADSLEARKLFRFAEQLRGAGLSISNNIAEGSGSTSNREFDQFLNYARRSVYECANIIIILQRRNHITEDMRVTIFNKLDEISRKITSFRKVLNPKPPMP
ncbi:four helix bundle protein [Dyadobacter sp. NIV53]|uniref:four helix bundle protein n=1 Tax=Dyadobacter sp. NIV53 TaxID=2861765 RepID=UPI001E5EDD67|nr:four helix bundle protein [Dyadobacter sp. NIV53]